MLLLARFRSGPTSQGRVSIALISQAGCRTDHRVTQDRDSFSWLSTQVYTQFGRRLVPAENFYFFLKSESGISARSFVKSSRNPNESVILYRWFVSRIASSGVGPRFRDLVEVRSFQGNFGTAIGSPCPSFGVCWFDTDRISWSASAVPWASTMPFPLRAASSGLRQTCTWPISATWETTDSPPANCSEVGPDFASLITTPRLMTGARTWRGKLSRRG